MSGPNAETDERRQDSLEYESQVFIYKVFATKRMVRVDDSEQMGEQEGIEYNRMIMVLPDLPIVISAYSSDCP